MDIKPQFIQKLMAIFTKPFRVVKEVLVDIKKHPMHLNQHYSQCSSWEQVNSETGKNQKEAYF